MAVGDLSSGAATYGATLASLTGLSPAVITAWLGAEEPWGSTDSTNNYLNIGPGYTYSTPQQGAQAAAALINNDSDYAGIKAAASQSPEAQISAIEASPWDVGGYNGQLGTVYSQVVASRPTASLDSITSWFTPFGGITNLGKALGKAPGEAASALGSAAAKGAAEGVKSVLSSSAIQKALLTVAFVGAALGLIILGLTRLFPGVTRTVTSTVGSFVGGATKAAAA